MTIVKERTEELQSICEELTTLFAGQELNAIKEKLGQLNEFIVNNNDSTIVITHDNDHYCCCEEVDITAYLGFLCFNYIDCTDHEKELQRAKAMISLKKKIKFDVGNPYCVALYCISK